MFLEEIIIFNYRSCKTLVLNLTENVPNNFIGLNDSGKSTTLSAINLLLGDRPKYNSIAEGNYRSDLSNSPADIDVLNKILEERGLPPFNNEGNATFVIGKLIYKDDEAEDFPDANLSTALAWSIESNIDNVLWYAKVYSQKGAQSYLLMSESEDPLLLWGQNQTRLNKLIKENKVTPEDIENENGKGRFSNFEKLRAIYEKFECSIQWSDYRFAKGDKDIFPSFSLFDWNTSLDEVIATANAIMKGEIDEHLEPIKNQANKSAKQAETAINKKFGELITIIKEVAKDVEGISSKVYFDVKEKIADVMVTKTYSDGPIHLENQGEGLKRQIWFSLIKAKADTSSESVNRFIWAFDEPETHLYPRAQREFFDVLTNIAKGNVQTLISTHSTIFIDKSNLNNIYNIEQEEDGYSVVSGCEDVEAIYNSLNVKNSDFLFHDKFLIVEGDTEQYLIPKLYEIYTGSNLIKDNIQLINIQGKDKWIINKAILEKIMKGFKKSDNQIVYLFDNDMSFVIGEAAIGDNMFFVGVQDIEDSISDEIWLAILNNFYDGTFDFTLEEIQGWKENVPVNTRCNNNQKFYSILKRGIKDKSMVDDVEYDTIDRLPSKGIESAELILQYLDSSEKIPQSIKDAFDKLIDE